MIQVDEADILNGDRALFKGGVVKIRNMPIAYLPVGYIPLDNERKSGFLTPSIGGSNLDGFTVGNTYFWAIDKHSDATFGLDYMAKRGVRGTVEYRYIPSRKTSGQFNATILDDNVTGKTFWKVDGFHNQQFDNGFSLTSKLDLTSESNFNKTFRNQTENRTRRSSDSFASLIKTWGNHSFDVLARYRESEQDGRDDTFGILPQATLKTQPVELGKTNLYFNQDSTFSTFVVDFDPSPTTDSIQSIQRFDFHPQISAPLALFPWLQFTPKVGVRETLYSNGYVGNRETGVLSRELIDINAILEGPKINKIFTSESDSGATRFKHIIEPRFQYDFIPDLDTSDRAQIRALDGIDSVPNTNSLSYFFTQRLLRKESSDSGASNTSQMARFEISQSYNFNEATRQLTNATDANRPFSNLRFDFDSLWGRHLMLNWDSTLNVYDGTIETFNFDVGVRPTDNLMVILERRLAHNSSASLLGTIDYNFYKGWNLTFSTRFDEFNEEILEKNGRLSFNDSCECYAFSIDVIQRNNINLGLRQEEPNPVQFHLARPG